MRVMLVQPNNAFLPEIQAYEEYFRRCGYETRLVSAPDEGEERDLTIVPIGFLPHWKRPQTGLILLDVASRSAGRFRRIKDTVKRLLNTRGDLVVCQNPYVEAAGLATGNSLRYRSMGYFEGLIEPLVAPEYELVYAGTVNRPGVLHTLKRLALLKYRMAIVGSSRPAGFETFTNLDWFARSSVREVYGIYAKSIAGLNLVPDIEPYSRQESTKLIEYVASGLEVFTTQYEWVSMFSSARGLPFKSVFDLTSEKIEVKRAENSADISDYSWSSIMRKLDVNAWIGESM